MNYWCSVLDKRLVSEEEEALGNLQSKSPVKTSSQQITTELLEEGGGP